MKELMCGGKEVNTSTISKDQTIHEAKLILKNYLTPARSDCDERRSLCAVGRKFPALVHNVHIYAQKCIIYPYWLCRL